MEAPDNDLDQVEILAGFVHHLDLDRLPGLRWVQAWSAGVNGLLADPAVMAADFTITTTSGIHAVPISELVLAYMTAFSRGLHRAVRAQTTATWDPEPWSHLSELADRTLLILGAGAIGNRVAELGRAFGMHTIGIRRGPVEALDPVFPVHPVARLSTLLPEADYVVNTLPLTAATRNLVDADTFARMKPGTFFVNIGRGATVDEEALIAALRSGHLGGAGLDVFREEPLPAESPLWRLENVIMTRHHAGSSPRYDERAMDLFLDNLDRYRTGRPLRNQVDRERGY
jgi:phosphoglycerate dehydrogenase-like enzyme